MLRSSALMQHFLTYQGDAYSGVPACGHVTMVMSLWSCHCWCPHQSTSRFMTIVGLLSACRALKLDEAAFASRLSPTEAVQQLLQTIKSLKPADSGRYLNLDGQPIDF